MNARSLAISTVAALVIGLLAVPPIVLCGSALNGGDTLKFPPSGISLRWFGMLFSGSWRQVWITTATVAALTACLATAVAVPLAFLTRWLAPLHRKLLFLAVSQSVILPLVLYALVLRRAVTFVGLLDYPMGLAFGHAVLALPLAYWVVYLDVRDVPSEVIRAARSLGASPLSAFVRVVLPMIRRGMLMAALFAAAISIADVTVCLYLSRQSLETVGSRLWVEMQFQYTPLAAAASVVLVFVGFCCYLTATAFGRSSRTRRGAT